MRIQTLFLLKIDLFMFTVNLIARDGDILCGLTQSTIFFISGNKLLIMSCLYPFLTSTSTDQ